MLLHWASGHVAALAAGAAAFALVLLLRLYFLRHKPPLPAWQRWLGAAIDFVGTLLYHIAEALLIAVILALFTYFGWLAFIVDCITKACGV
jgi:hypothetical protein